MTLKEEIEDILHPENKMLNIAKERLRPPMAPVKCEFCGRDLILYRNDWICGHGCIKPAVKPIASEKSVPVRIEGESRTALPSNLEGVATTDSKLAIDFSYLTNNSSFQRAIIEFIRKYIPGFENVNPRASKNVMTKSFNKNIANYKEVMAELKLKLKEKRVE